MNKGSVPDEKRKHRSKRDGIKGAVPTTREKFLFRCVNKLNKYDLLFFLMVKINLRDRHQSSSSLSPEKSGYLNTQSGMYQKNAGLHYSFERVNF